MLITSNVNQASFITHAGTFHADEVLATVILRKIFGEDITVCRTIKVPEEGLSDDVIVYDIGHGKYDHHQRSGNGRRPNGVPYAAAGLIWKDYGLRVVNTTSNPDLVWDLIDRTLIQCVDALDNGQIPPLDYPAQMLSFAQIISAFNPSWDSKMSADEAFIRAVDFAESIFDTLLANAESKAKAKSIVDEAIAHAEGHIMVLDHFVPWQEFLFSSESEKAQDIQFVVFPSNRCGFNWQCVPDTLGGFGQRKTVPADWKGLRDVELQNATGVQTASFCHPAGFIGGAETREDAILLAKLAVEAN